MEQYKKLIDEFNQLVSRFNKAEMWFNANADKVTERHIQELQHIIKESSIRMKMIETYRGTPLTPEETTNGITNYEI